MLPQLQVSLVPARGAHLGILKKMVRAYHAFDGLQVTNAQREAALYKLLAPDQSLGRLWLIRCDSALLGYVALTFGFSIEHGGQDAFIDEFFILAEARGQGLGRRSLELIIEEAQQLGLRALHLIVARTNAPAQRLYTTAGFADRGRFQLMSRPLTSAQTPVLALNGDA